MKVSVDAMPDVQARRDDRRLAIQRVGIRDVRHPMWVATADGPKPTVADWSLAVTLPADQKGTHMSRFMALLERHRETPLTLAGFGQMSQEMLELLDAHAGSLEASFPYFIAKTAPVSGVRSLMDYQMRWRAEASLEGTVLEVKLVVPVTTLCPCSKSISEYGAHNQRSHITVTVQVPQGEAIDLEALIRTVEAQASCELFGLLKRTDEKFVTERAYDNPKFVEDLVRDVANAVANHPGVGSFVAEAENFESIHNHSAWAVIEG